MDKAIGSTLCHYIMGNIDFVSAISDELENIKKRYYEGDLDIREENEALYKIIKEYMKCSMTKERFGRKSRRNKAAQEA